MPADHVYNIVVPHLSGIVSIPVLVVLHGGGPQDGQGNGHVNTVLLYSHLMGGNGEVGLGQGEVGPLLPPLIQGLRRGRLLFP